MISFTTASRTRLSIEPKLICPWGLRKIQSTVGLAAFALLLFMVAGCFRPYLKTNTRYAVDDNAKPVLKDAGKYVILHVSNGNFALRNIQINNNLVEGDVGGLAANHMKYNRLKPNASPSFRGRDRDAVLSEVHLFTDSVVRLEHMRLPMKAFNRMDVFEYNQGKTTASRIMSSVGIAAGLTAFIAMIVVAAECNCPQVYTKNQDGYQFKGGVFSGAIYASLEKTDYLPLGKLKAQHGLYEFKLANGQEELQYLNEIQLVGVAHPPAFSVLLDRQGKAHAYQHPSGPITATDGTNAIPEVLREKDNSSYSFYGNADTASTFSSIIMTFPRPATAKASLVVHAKNSGWSGYIFDRFSSMFGESLQQWTSLQDKASRPELEKWQRDQALPLMVYVRKGEAWQFVDYFAMTGNTASRDLIMSIPVPPGSTGDLEVKIESAYMFWELDYAAVANEEQQPIALSRIAPQSASVGSTSGMAPLLSAKDSNYAPLKQFESLQVFFQKPEKEKKAGETITYFLANTGYYHIVKTYPGKADVSSLQELKKPGAFDRFSRTRFGEAKKLLAAGIHLPSSSPSGN